MKQAKSHPNDRPALASGEMVTSAVKKNQVLQSRAGMLARCPEAAVAAGSEVEMLEFSLADEKYLMESCFIREIFALKELTPLPCTPAFVLGIINVRGQIVTVIDLKRFFDLPSVALSDLNKVIIVHNDETEFGILADLVVGVRRVARGAVQAALPTLSGVRAQYTQGVVVGRSHEGDATPSDEPLIVLDSGKILSDPKMLVSEEVG